MVRWGPVAEKESRGYSPFPPLTVPAGLRWVMAKAGSVKDTFAKIQSKDVRIDIMGLGYVSLPLAFAEKYTVLGYDADRMKRETRASVKDMLA